MNNRNYYRLFDALGIYCPKGRLGSTYLALSAVLKGEKRQEFQSLIKKISLGQEAVPSNSLIEEVHLKNSLIEKRVYKQRNQLTPEVDSFIFARRYRNDGELRDLAFACLADASQLEYPPALCIMGTISKNESKKVDYFIRAGEKGLAEGYELLAS